LFKRANINAAYWVIFLFLIISLTTFTLFFVEHQRNLLTELEESSLKNELEIATEFIREDIAAERYQHIEPFFQLWAHKNHKIINIKAIANNGFVISEHLASSRISSHTLKLDKEVEGPVGVSLEVVFDLQEIDKEINSLTILFIITNIGFIILLMLLLWYIVQHYLVKPLRNSEDKYIKLATKDPLTKINNRRAFEELTRQQISHCKRHSRPLSMLLIDLDHFKKVNDNFGHHVGDHILHLVTSEINMMIRDTDVFGRLGGEEFAICLPELSTTAALLTAERIRQRIESLPSLEKDNIKFPITVSIGLCELTDNEDTTSLIQRCDALLYEAKGAGRNCVKSQGE